MTQTEMPCRAMGVVTSQRHEAELRRWLEGDAGACAWVIADDNPDIEAMLGAFARQMASVAIVDDDAMVHKEVSESDLLKFAAHRNRNGMRIVFVAGPQRMKDDPLFGALIEAGVADIVPTRYFADDPDGCRAFLRTLLRQGMSVEQIRSALDNLPDEPKGLFRKKRKSDEVADILASAESAPAKPEAEPEGVDEFDFFSSMASQQPEPQPEPKPEPQPAEQPAPQPGGKEGAASSIDIDALRLSMGITGTAPAASPASAKPEAKPQPSEALAEPKAEPKPAQPAPATEPKPVQQPARQGRRCQRIAVAGLAHRVGTTHLVQSLAFCIKEMEPSAKVCCLMSDKREFDAMVSGNGFPVGKDGMHSRKGVSFAFLGMNDLPEGFDFMVIDCDVFNPGSESRVSRLFSTASKRIVVCGGLPWQISQVSSILETLEREELNRLSWCLFGATSAFTATLIRAFEAKGARPAVFEIPYQNNYLDPKASMAPEYKALLSSKRKKKKNPDGGAQAAPDTTGKGE